METESDRIPGIRFVLDQGDDISAAAADGLVAEVERLRATLVEERAARIYTRYGLRSPEWEQLTKRDGVLDSYRIQARAELIAEGLLPPA
jgi:hypothetical protein